MGKIENKIWDEYSKKEQIELLQHWWYYYGKIIFTMEEWEQFNKLVEKDSNKIFELAVISYMNNLSSQPLIYAMRKNKVDNLLSILPKIKMEKLYEEAKNEFLSILIKTYNKPEPSIPMEPKAIIKQVKKIIKENK